jgi:alpha-1,3-rhamnosyltransferase
MINPKPEVSLCLLSWNHAGYMQQCIESVAAQTFRNFEIVYLDNHSTDGTYELALELLSQTGIPHRVFKNEHPQSIAHNFNFLLDHSDGDFIVPLSTDDWLLPTFLEEKVAFFATHPDTGMVYNGGFMYFEHDQKTYPVDNSNFRRGRIYKELLQEDNVLFFVGCCYRRDIFEKVGKWDESLLIEDMDMFIRIARHYDIDYIDKPLVNYRKVNSSTANNIAYMVRGWEQYYKKYRHLQWIDMKKWLAGKYRSYAALAIDRNDKREARRLIRKSLSLAPTDMKNYRTLLYLLRK